MLSRIMDFTPWDRYPALSQDRLIVIAEAIRRGRRSALQAFEPDAGDTGWGLGVKAYERECFQIREAAKLFDWLTIVNEDFNRFTFAIEDVPLKFYRGNPNDPTSRTLTVSPAEFAYQLNLFGESSENLLLRLAVETQDFGEVISIALVELADSSPRGIYRIPAASSSVVTMTARPIDPGPPLLLPIAQVEVEAIQATGTEGNASS